MKKTLRTLLLSSKLSDPFISQWQTTASSELVQLPVSNNYIVDWGDGVITSNQTSHTYATANTYTIKIYGDITDFSFNNIGDKFKIKLVTQFGKLQIIQGSFFGCNTLNITATDSPIITSNCISAFNTCSSLVFNTSINNWDTSLLVNADNMFSGCTLFNQPLSNWDVSNVQTFSGMFFNNTAFNQELNTWTTTSATNMSLMFRGCSNFNKDLDNWTTTSVTSTLSMFALATNFNGNVTTWNMGSVTNSSFMFRDCVNFNQDISGWNMSSAIDINSMFRGASSFNIDISGWNISNVENISSFLQSATAFDINLSTWDFSSVTNMSLFMLGKTFSDYTATNLSDLYNRLDDATFGLVFANMVNANISFGTIKYTASGSTARANLVSKGFIITDGGLL